MPECMFCGEEFEPQYSTAERADDYCSSEHQQLAFAGGGPDA